MSKFSSVALGKVTGSIGNITTSRLKGQQIAKAKITQTTASDSLTQLASKNKMKNVVMAYQFLAGFLSRSGGLRKQTESVYNAFVRGFKTSLADTVSGTRYDAASMLVGLQGLAGNLVSVVSIAPGASDITVSINTGGLPFISGCKCRLITFATTDGRNEIVEVSVSEGMWNSGEILVVPTGSVETVSGAYVYTADQKKCSNILFA